MADPRNPDPKVLEEEAARIIKDAAREAARLEEQDPQSSSPENDAPPERGNSFTIGESDEFVLSQLAQTGADGPVDNVFAEAAKDTAAKRERPRNNDSNYVALQLAQQIAEMEAELAALRSRLAEIEKQMQEVETGVLAWMENLSPEDRGIIEGVQSYRLDFIAVTYHGENKLVHRDMEQSGKFYVMDGDKRVYFNDFDNEAERQAAWRDLNAQRGQKCANDDPAGAAEAEASMEALKNNPELLQQYRDQLSRAGQIQFDRILEKQGVEEAIKQTEENLKTAKAQKNALAEVEQNDALNLEVPDENAALAAKEFDSLAATYGYTGIIPAEVIAELEQTSPEIAKLVRDKIDNDPNLQVVNTPILDSSRRFGALASMETGPNAGKWTGGFNDAANGLAAAEPAPKPEEPAPDEPKPGGNGGPARMG